MLSKTKALSNNHSYLLLLAITILFSCSNKQQKCAERIPYTQLTIYYPSNEEMPWLILPIAAVVPSDFLEWHLDTIIETNPIIVSNFYSYFDSLSKGEQSRSLDERFRHIKRHEYRQLDTRLAVVFDGKEGSDTLALSCQHWGGMTFHGKFFIDSVGHFKIFNAIMERDNKWKASFNRLYHDGQYLFPSGLPREN